MINIYTYSLSNIQVIDGDTIKANIDLGFKLIFVEKVIRLFGINAPETTKTIKGSINLSQSAGLNSKQFISSVLIPNPKVYFQSVSKFDSFGRALGIIFYLDSNGLLINLNEQLITNKLASNLF